MCGPAEIITGVGIGMEMLGIGQEASASAGMSKEQAKIAEQKAKYESARLRRQAKKLTSEQITGYAKAGVTLAGSPLEVLAETAKEMEMEAMAVEQFGASEAAARRYEARATQQAGQIRQAATLLAGIGELM